MLEKFNEVKDYRWLKRYLKFIETFRRDSIYKNHTHNHHILPQKLYSEYKNLTKNPWNLAILSYREHLVAHYMLAKALQGNMWFAYNNMNAYGERLNSVLYESAMIEYNKVNSLKKINTVCAKNIFTDEILIVTTEEFNSNEDLVGVTKGLFVGDKNASKSEDVRNLISLEMTGRIHCIDKLTGERKFLKFEDYNDNNFERIIPIDNNGFTAIKTEDGIKRITTEEFNNGDYEHYNKGITRSQEFKDNLSKKMKGVKKKNTTNYNKVRILVSPENEIFEFVGNKSLQDFCYIKNISLTILRKYPNSKVTEITKSNRPKLIETSKNTIGWKLKFKGNEDG